MSKHTPGPWHVDHSNGSFAVCGQEPVAFIYERRDYAQTQEADATLIATAPDMLAALKAIEFEMSDGWQAPEDFDIVPDDEADTLVTATAKSLAAWKLVRAAIAKAEDRS